eukprot:Em0009g173a
MTLRGIQIEDYVTGATRQIRRELGSKEDCLSNINIRAEKLKDLQDTTLATKLSREQVICDYETRYPEPVPLNSIESECVAEELIKTDGLVERFNQSLKSML